MNLQKLVTLRSGNRSVFSRLLSKIDEAKENSSLIEFNATLETLELKIKTLESLNEKILSQTEIDQIEEELISTEEYTLDLEIKIRKLKEFQRAARKSGNHAADSSGCKRTDSRERDTGSNVNVGANGHSRITGSHTTGGQDGNGKNQYDIGETGSRYNSHGIGTNLHLTATGSQNTIGNVSFNSANSSQYHRLPKLSLPTFSGDILSWQTFWDSFESTVHLNYNLTDVQKFANLKSQLEGEAIRTIDSFAVIHTNYARAIELFIERYGQKHKIIHATMQALLKLPAPMNNLYGIREFYDKMETYIRSLESMGQQQETYGDLLVPIVLDKLPAEIRKNLAREHGDNNWLLSDLRRSIHKEINIMEAGSCKITKPEVDLYGTTASLYTGAISDRNHGNTNSLRPIKPIKCAFCEESHVASECRKYPDVKSRVSVVKEKKLYFNCLGKHQVFLCKSKKRCLKCNRKHHTTICRSESSQTPQAPSNSAQHVPETPVMHLSTNQFMSGALLKTAISEHRGSCYKDTYSTAAILFDEGAQRSFITEALANELQLPRESTEAIRLAAFGSSNNKIQHIETATVYLVTEKKQKIPIRVLIVPTIATPIDNTHRSNIASLQYLKGLKLAHPITQDREFAISLLIGADFYWDIVQDEIIRGRGPTAVKSKIGYLLSGPINNRTSISNVGNIFNVMASRIPDEMSLERFWNLESLGISNNDTDRKLQAEMQQYQQTSIDFKDNRYTARLPWKPDHSELPTNYDIVLKRTESTIRRLSREPEMLTQYGNIITEQETRGFIEKVPETEINSGKRVHYIPHHHVKKESSTTPIRIVYDCSCRQTPHHPSLNDCLQSTPPVLNELTSILLRFRLYTYAVTTDIEKAFLHVGLHEDDRDMTRFLWLKDPSNPSSNLATYRFRAVLFGAKCSPFMLNATILKHLENNAHVKAAEVLRRDLYVDNVISSFQQEYECLRYFTDARTLMSNAGMNLRSWNSNSEKLRENARRENVQDTDDVTKVLGLRWETSTDELSYAKRKIQISTDTTKRVILKYSSQIYDPLGLLSPVTVRAKILLQEIWKQKYEWDVPLPEDIQQTWACLAKDLNTVTEIKFPRRYLQQTTNATDEMRTTLHIFVDASVRSYGAVAFICNEEASRLVIAKNRVAPLKTLTLPRLELMAALIGARLSAHLRTIFPAAEVTLCSDSQIVLHWLSTKKPLTRFVANRVTEIQDLTKQYTWKYCPTSDNPADLLTRGITAEKFMNNDLWMRGPKWLPNKSQWPTWDTPNSYTCRR